MGRKCSHCGKMGHNSRTCNSRRRLVNGGRFRLFGVQLDHHHHRSSSSSSSSPSSFSRSFSIECLSSTSSNISSPSSCNSSSNSRLTTNSTGPAPSALVHHHEEISDKLSNGYASDGLIARSAQERKKGNLFCLFNYIYMSAILISSTIFNLLSLLYMYIL